MTLSKDGHKIDPVLTLFSHRKPMDYHKMNSASFQIESQYNSKAKHRVCIGFSLGFQEEIDHVMTRGDAS